MGQGKFINRKLAKRSGHAQRQARLDLEAQRGSKPSSPKQKRAIIPHDIADRKPAGS